MLLRLNPLVVCLHVAVVVDADVFDVVVIFVGSYYRYFGRFCNGVVVTFCIAFWLDASVLRGSLVRTNRLNVNGGVAPPSLVSMRTD